MIYALLKLTHLLGTAVWIGGMFFTLFCLRPAAMSLQPPVRVAFMQAVLGRFFSVVAVAGLLTVGSGLAMVLRTRFSSTQAGISFNMPIDWWTMAVLGLVMLAVFSRVALVLYPRLKRAVADQEWQAGGVLLGEIRNWVAVNLGLGTLIVVVVVMGAMT
jgi:uncharacterized membrane protein